MEKELFYNEIQKKVEAHFAGRASVTATEVTKNNGLVKKGLCVRSHSSNCAPTLYMNDFYNELGNGKSLDDIAQDIISVYEDYIVNEPVDLSFFQNFDSIYDKICFKIVSKERNIDKLKAVPHRMMEDLAVIYFVSLNAMGIDGSVAVKNEFLKMWDCTEEDLYEAAMDNTPRLYPAEIITMGDFMSSKLGDDRFKDAFDVDSMLVASNSKCVNGAAVLLYPGLLDEVAKRLDSDFYIIPSSIHEVILLKDMNGIHGTEALLDMIKSVNDSCVPSEEVLSDSLYYYDRTIENSVKKVEVVKDTML